MKVAILAGGLGSRLGEETTVRPKPMVEIGGKPILWHIMKIYSHYGFNEFVVMCGYKGEYIKEYFLNYRANSSDITIDLSDNSVQVHKNRSEPWKITLCDTGKETLTGGRIAQIKKYISMNGGNRSGIAFAEVDPLGYVHPDQFTQHHTFGNVRERKFGDIWQDTTNPIMAGLKDRKPLLKGRCAKCKFLDNCNGNFRTRAEARTGDFWESDPSCYLTDEEIGIVGGEQ